MRAAGRPNDSAAMPAAPSAATIAAASLIRHKSAVKKLTRPRFND
jgi:hypothetical protein